MQRYEVNQFLTDADRNGQESHMLPHDEGDWVRWEDYESIARSRELMQELVSKLMERSTLMEGMIETYKEKVGLLEQKCATLESVIADLQTLGLLHQTETMFRNTGWGADDSGNFSSQS